MFVRKPPFSRRSKKGDINKEIIEQIKDTKRKMKEKIPKTESEKNQDEF
jgi:hypothetical protein